MLFLLCIRSFSLFAQAFYWENPLSITTSYSVFPLALYNSTDSYVFFQEVDTAKKEIYLSCKKFNSLDNVSDIKRFAGPFSYSTSEVPDIYSAAINDDGLICLAVLSAPGEISIYSSNDKAASFKRTVLPSSSIMIAPRIYKTRANTFKLFTSSGDDNSFTIFTSESKDGVNWSRVELFSPAEKLQNPFIPVLIPYQNGDLVVFQAQYISEQTNRFSYQLYLTLRNSPGGSWSSPLLITNENSLYNNSRYEYYRYQNQQPALIYFEDQLYIAWERTQSVNSSIWVAGLSPQGIISGSAEELTLNGNASKPRFFNYQNSLYLTWFDTRNGRESVYMSKKEGNYWNESPLVENNNSNLFVSPLLINDGQSPYPILNFIFQQTGKNNKNTIALLPPDKSVKMPQIKPLSYKNGKRSRSEKVDFDIIFPEDSSGLKAYSYLWTRDSSLEAPKSQMQIIRGTDKNKKMTFSAQDGDGDYYLCVRVQDYADNWSDSKSIKYTLDTTPPKAPQISLENCDSYNILDSNNFSISWLPSEDKDTSGYIYKFEYLFDIPKALVDTKRHPMKLSEEKKAAAVEKLKARYEKVNKKKKLSSPTRTTKLSSSKYYNYANGLYVFYVAAVDEVGNTGDFECQMFIVNKYEPSTFISSAQLVSNEAGGQSLTIRGGGFTYDGTIDSIIIDRDGKAPYDLVLEKSKNQYKVQSNKVISDIKLNTELEDGSYRILLHHTDRGTYKSGSILRLENQGNVKIEADFVMPKEYTSEFIRYKYTVTAYIIVLILLILLGIISIVILTVYLSKSSLENLISNYEVKSLLEGKAMPMKKLNKSLKHQPSLKYKLIVFTFLIIIISVFIVAFQNGFRSVNLQKQTMAEGLENRTEVLLESIHSGVKNFLPSNNILELSALPEQKDAMDEVKFVTITGQAQNSSSADELDYIWATNDPSILEKSDSYTLTYGASKIKDPVYLEIEKKFSELDKNIPQEILNLSQQIEELTNQANTAYATLEPDELESVEYISQTVVDLRNKSDTLLLEFSKENAGSYPPFDSQNLDMVNTDYIFYRPVLYRKGNTGNFVHAVIFIELSTQTLIDSVKAETLRIIKSVLLVSLIVILIGIISAYSFAVIIIKPIKKLESHLFMIGHTKNKADLKNKDIVLKSKDEIGRLGTAVNDMTHELVKVAEEEVLTLDGKAVQNAFLPLKEKGSTAEYEDSKIQCFGYYEGESGVSGDYFDYRKLDDQWYVAIKCDASGHGVPAAIIMTVVATLFREYFNSWSYKKNGTSVNKLIEQVNDAIESLGLRGKFATMILCLINQNTGDLYMCNAGDTLVHIYDSAEKKMKVITLSNAPTAGVFSSDLIAMRGGFKVEKGLLKHGDILYLYTDGIEESTRRVRDPMFQPKFVDVQVKKVNPKTGQEEVEYKTEEEKEEFGPERVSEIIEAVLNRRKYRLTKVENPKGDEVLEFDFTEGKGTIEETILALAACEKVFRMYKKNDLNSTQYIKVDKIIDAFLEKYFNLYSYYAANKVANESTPNYLDYEYLQEDEQSDDLTMLAIKRI